MTIWKMTKPGETIYILQVGRFSVSTNLTFSFQPIGLDGFWEEGFDVYHKDVI